MTKNRQTKGVCIACLKNKVLTEEHVILKSFGGGFAPALLCKGCNNSFGAGIDKQFEEQLPNRLARNAAGISGRANRVVGAFEGVEGVLQPLGVKVKGSKGLTFRVLSDYEIEFVENGLRIKGSFDKALTFDYVKTYIMQTLPAKLKAKNQTLSEQEVEFWKKKLLSQLSESNLSSGEGNVINFTDKIDIKILQLGFIKIAYELACYAHGVSYFLKSTKAPKIRGALLNPSEYDCDMALLYPKETMVSDVLNEIHAQKKNAVILFDGFAHIQLFGTICTVQYEDFDSEILQDTFANRIFIFGYNGEFQDANFCAWLKDKCVKDTDFHKMISARYNQSESFR